MVHDFLNSSHRRTRLEGRVTRARIKRRLLDLEAVDPPVEFSFKVRDRWSHQLLVALLRRYDIKPYRYRGQRRTTVMARVPARFVNETLWPEFQELNRTLVGYIAEVTRRVIAEGIGGSDEDIEERAEQLGLPSEIGGADEAG